MAKRIITISREFGSGGRFIGEETAKKPVYQGKFELLRIFGFTYRQISCIIELHESGGNPASVFPQR